MKLKKPKFWDYKKSSFFSYLLLPFSITIRLIAKIGKKTLNETKDEINSLLNNEIKKT